MGNLLGPIISGVFGLLKQALIPLVAYFQGKKVAKLEGKEQALEDAKDAAKDRNEISNLDDDSLNSIVFSDNERGDT